MKLRQLFSTYPYQWTVLLLDTVGFFVCMYLAYSLRFEYSSLTSSFPLALFCTITITSLYLFNSYQHETFNHALSPVIKSISAIIVALGVTMIYVYVIGRGNFIPLYGRGVLPVGFLLFGIFAVSLRYILIRFSFFKVNNNWLYIGSQRGADWLAIENEKHRNKGSVTFFITDENDGDEKSQIIEKINSQLDSHNNKQKWQNIIIYNFSDLPVTLQKSLIKKRTMGWPVLSFSEFVSRTWMKIPILHIADQWIMDNDGFALFNNSLQIHSKKLLDWFITICALIFALPVMCILAILIPLDSKGPIFFTQKRIGTHGKVFTVYKFRTMRKNADKDGAKWADANDVRITRLGKSLRKFRLDELPQLFNVCKGEMSFIGPRPEQPEFVVELEKEIPYYNLRHTVKPGITGWAQVAFQYGNTVDHAREKLEYDLYYVKNQSLMLDALIIAKTIKTIIYAQGH